MMRFRITGIPIWIRTFRHANCFSFDMDFESYTKQVLEAERFPLGDIVVCILVATACISLLMVLAWFLFRPRLFFPRRDKSSRELKRNGG